MHTLREQLATLGYKDIRSGYDMVVRNRRNTPLYYVVFASKHQLGHTLWKAIARFEPSGQGSLL